MWKWLKQDFSLITVIGKLLDIPSTEWIDDKSSIFSAKILSWFSIRATAKLYPCYYVASSIEDILSFL